MHLKNEPLVTVLTPVYNGARYLSDCIESVLAQTYQNWEYVIVNNCSTDRTLEIAQNYARNDARIRIQTNRELVGMAANHNIAFRQISPNSKYCKVVHADDWLFPECLRQMVKVAEAHSSVGIVGAYGLSGVRVRWDGLPYPSTVVSGREICRRTLLGGFYVFGSPTSYLVRSDLIRGRERHHNENELHAQFSDQEACYEVLQNTDFGFVHQVLSYSRDHEESVSSSVARTVVNNELPSQLIMLIQYGPVYLTSEEYEKRFKWAKRRYYRFLCRNVFQWRNKEFWNYHKRALSHVGSPFSVMALLRVLPLEIIDTILTPKPIAARVLSKALRLVNR